jgi:hypothetical protein
MTYLWNDADKVRLKYSKEQLAKVTLFPTSIKGLRDEKSASERLSYDTVSTRYQVPRLHSLVTIISI